LAGQLTRASTHAESGTLDLGLGHPLSGPLFVHGAEPGDVLEVQFIRYETADFGVTAVIPGFGFLADLFPEPYLVKWEIAGGVPGALCSIGDLPFAQGDGEVCGTAIEVAGAATVRFAVHKSPAGRTRFPSYETPDRPGGRSFATTGIPVDAGMDLNAAAREALLEMIAHLERTYGFERPAAYALCSAVVDLRVSEAVDVPYPV